MDELPQAEVIKKIVATARKRAKSEIKRRMWVDEKRV